MNVFWCLIYSSRKMTSGICPALSCLFLRLFCLFSSSIFSPIHPPLAKTPTVTILQGGTCFLRVRLSSVCRYSKVSESFNMLGGAVTRKSLNRCPFHSPRKSVQPWMSESPDDKTVATLGSPNIALNKQGSVILLLFRGLTGL